jgi:hypothetical protein
MSLKMLIIIVTFVIIYQAGCSTAMVTSIKGSDAEQSGHRTYDKDEWTQHLKSRFHSFFNRTNPNGGNPNAADIEDRNKIDKNKRIDEIRGQFESFFNRFV